MTIEVGGHLAVAGRAYLNHWKMTPGEITLMRDYFVQWSCSPEHDDDTRPELAVLRITANNIQTRRDIDEWLADALDKGYDQIGCFTNFFRAAKGETHA